MKDTKLLRIGIVSSTNPEKATVTVAFPDIDNMVTTDLPVIFPQGLKNKAYAMPDVGENVLCVFIGQGRGDGFCIGCFYTPDCPPPISEKDKVHYTFEDGTFIEYDRKEHKLIADVNGDADIKVKNVKLDAKDIEATCENLKASSKQATVTTEQADIISKIVTLSCEQLNISASGDITIKGKKITLQGSSTKEVIN